MFGTSEFDQLCSCNRAEHTMAVGPGEGDSSVGRGARGAVGEADGDRVGEEVGTGAGSGVGAGIGTADGGLDGVPVGAKLGNTDSDGDCVGCANTLPSATQK